VTAVSERARSFDRGLLPPLVLGAVLNPINSTMVAVALVPIGIAFGASPADTAWLVSGLYVATAIGQPVVGRLVDTYGPRSLFLVGTTLVGLSGILGMVAPQLWVLVVSRVLLGFGTCAGYPAAMYLIRAEAARTGMASPAGVLAVLTVSTQTIAVVGPTLGGLLIGVGGWPAIFAMNIPLAVIAFVLGAWKLPRTPRVEAAPRLDYPGVVLFAGALLGVLVFLMSPSRWWLVPVAVVLGAVFAWRELRVPDPFLDLRLLAGNGPLLATYARTLLAFVLSYAYLYGYTQWLQEGRGLSPSVAGLMLLPMSITSLVVSALTGRGVGVRGKLVVGSLLQVVVCLGLLTFTDGTPVWMIVALSVLVGVPNGLINLANQNALYHQADPARIGASSGLFRTFGYLGAIIASLGNGTFLAERADTAGLHDLAVFLLLVALVFVVVTLADRSLRHVVPTTDDRVPEEP